ncbi:MAG: hemerythrin domain-containing protein [Acidobacteriota bacterium]
MSNVHQILETDHRELDALFDSVFAAVKAADRDLTFSTLDLFWARLAMHIRAEHLLLFPAIRNTAEGSSAAVAEQLERLRHDHDFFMTRLARAIKALRLTPHFGNETETLKIVREIITAVRERLIEHNVIEEEVVYPSANHLENTADLAAAIRKELDNYPARFARPASPK